jgi:hypothetical protein
MEIMTEMSGLETSDTIYNVGTRFLRINVECEDLIRNPPLRKGNEQNKMCRITKELFFNMF